MKIGIIGAMKLEIDELLNDLTEVNECITADNIYYAGKLGDSEVVITSCGVGKVNAALCTQILISEYEVDCVINTGIAGSMDEKVRIGDIVVSEDVVHHDVSPNLLIEFYPHEEVFKADEYLKNIAMEVLEYENNLCHHLGRIVSGEKFVGSNELKLKIKGALNPLCVEMEGAAIGHVAYANKVPFLVIRCISDNADDEATETYEEFELRTAKQSAFLLRKIIAKMS